MSKPVIIEEHPRDAILSVEFLTTARFGEDGELTVPKEYCKALRLRKGMQVAVLRLGGGLLLVPERARFDQLCNRISGAFASHGITEADLLKTLPEARQRVFERHYPKLAKAEKTHRKKAGKKRAG